MLTVRSVGFVLLNDTGDSRLFTVIHGLSEARCHFPFIQPFPSPMGNGRMCHISEHFNTGDQPTLKTELTGRVVIVNFVFRRLRRVVRLDGVAELHGRPPFSFRCHVKVVPTIVTVS